MGSHLPEAGTVLAHRPPNCRLASRPSVHLARAAMFALNRIHAPISSDKYQRAESWMSSMGLSAPTVMPGGKLIIRGWLAGHRKGLAAITGCNPSTLR